MAEPAGHVEIEPVSAFLRYWESKEEGYGDPYAWTACARYISKDVVEICAVDKEVTIDCWKAIKVSFRNAGVKKIIFDRIKDGKVRRKEVVL